MQDRSFFRRSEWAVRRLSAEGSLEGWEQSGRRWVGIVGGAGVDARERVFERCLDRLGRDRGALGLLEDVGPDREVGYRSRSAMKAMWFRNCRRIAVVPRTCPARAAYPVWKLPSPRWLNRVSRFFL